MQRTIKSAGLGIALVLALTPTTALAATIEGGPEGERLLGTPWADVINGNDGNDRIAGGAGDDVLGGGAGNDVILANLGRDVLRGGDGNDQLWALARGDVQPGPGGATDTAGDALDGGPGDDVFHVRDGEADVVVCGPGNDVVLADPVDVIADATPESPNGSCEKVVRLAPRGHPKAEDRWEQGKAKGHDKAKRHGKAKAWHKAKGRHEAKSWSRAKVRATAKARHGAKALK